jgi:hypothetical protein
MATAKQCIRDGCDKPVLARRLCGSHYRELVAQAKAKGVFSRRGRLVEEEQQVTRFKPWTYENPEGERLLMELNEDVSRRKASRG